MNQIIKLVNKSIRVTDSENNCKMQLQIILLCVIVGPVGGSSTTSGATKLPEALHAWTHRDTHRIW